MEQEVEKNVVSGAHAVVLVGRFEGLRESRQCASPFVHHKRPAEPLRRAQNGIQVDQSELSTRIEFTSRAKLTPLTCSLQIYRCSRFIGSCNHRFEEVVYCHIRALKYLLAADEKNVWKNQKRILESDMRVGVSCRCCVSFLQENGSEWMTPSILQWCRESRKLANSVVPPFTPHS